VERALVTHRPAVNGRGPAIGIDGHGFALEYLDQRPNDPIGMRGTARYIDGILSRDFLNAAHGSRIAAHSRYSAKSRAGAHAHDLGGLSGKTLHRLLESDFLAAIRPRHTSMTTKSCGHPAFNDEDEMLSLRDCRNHQFPCTGRKRRMV
jgi:hypothetical protein